MSITGDRRVPTLPGIDAPSGQWGRLIGETVRLSQIFVFAFHTALSLLMANASLDLSNPVAATGLLLAAGAQIVAAAAVWRRVSSVVLPPVVMILTVVGVALALTGNTADPVRDTWWPGPLLVAALLYLVLNHPQGGLLATALVVTNAYLRWHTATSIGSPDVIQVIAVEAMQQTAIAGTAYLVARTGSDAAARADASREEDRSLQAALAVARSQSGRAQEVDRFVHDEVLHTLRLVAMDRTVVPAEAAAEAAERLNRLLLDQETGAAADPRPADLGLVEQLRAIAAEFDLDTRVQGPGTLSVPAEVAAALEAAVREALRNVQRHAGVDEAAITVRRQGLQVAVTVSDHGVGFDPEQLPPDRHGVVGSILSRMQDIGGGATVETAPGSGTRVVLRWSPALSTPERPGALGSGAAPQFFPALVLIVAPMVVANLWYPIWLASSLRWPGLVAVASVVLVAVTAVAALLGLRGGLTAPRTAAILAVGGACSAINGLALNPDTLSTTYYWLSAGAGFLAFLLAMFRSTYEGLGFGAALSLIAAATTYSVSPDLGVWLTFLPVITSPIVIVLIAVIVRALADRFAWEILRTEDEVSRSQTRLAAQEEFIAQLRRRLSDRRTVLTDFLNDVVAGGGRDPEFCRTAAELELGMREDLALGERATLARRVERARANGWQVTVRCPDSLPHRGEAFAVAALNRLPTAPADGDSALTLNVLPRGASWRLSLLATGPGADLAGPLWQELDWTVNSAAGEVHAVREVTDPDPVARPLE